MRISLQQMLTKLSKFAPVPLCGETTVFRFRTIRFWDGRFDAGALYIADASQLSAEYTASGSFQLLCVLDQPLSPVYLDGSAKIITFPANTSKIEIYNELSEHLSDLMNGSVSIQALMGHLVHGSFDEILASISKIIRKSVVLFSSNLRLISMAAYAGDGSAHWDVIQKLGYYPGLYRLPPEFSSGAVLIRNADRFYEFSEDIAAGGEIFAPIIADNLTREILGYLYFNEPNHDALFDNAESIAFICHTLSWRMWKFTHTPERTHTILTDVLCSLLNGTIPDEQTIVTAVSRAGLRQRGHRLLAVVSFGGSATDAAAPAERWSDFFKETWSRTISFLYNGDLVLVIQAESSEELAEKALPALCERILLMNCFAGISDRFTELDCYFLNHYTRALSAMQMAAVRGKPACLRYDEIALEHIVHFGRVAASRAVVDPRLLRLLKSDQEFSTDYLKTLRQFWVQNRDVSKTCAELHIHRSTLFYRLKKIKDILGEDILSHNRYLQLCISIAILENMGEIPYVKGKSQEFTLRFKDGAD